MQAKGEKQQQQQQQHLHCAAVDNATACPCCHPTLVYALVMVACTGAHMQITTRIAAARANEWEPCRTDTMLLRQPPRDTLGSSITPRSATQSQRQPVIDVIKIADDMYRT